MTSDGTPIPVNVSNFIRAESDLYFERTVMDGGLGQFYHRMKVVGIDEQTVVRMNRDTLYSSGVFDLDAGPVTVTLPDTGKRFVSMMALSQDHYAFDVVYAPVRRTYTRERVGTRYLFLAIRTLVDAADQDDVNRANRLQNSIKVDQANTGLWEKPNWDELSQKKVRDALALLGSLGGLHDLFGTKDEVNPVCHLIGTACGWGGNPKHAASYTSVFPKANDGYTIHVLTVRDVPVDSFWSISVYNSEGYFEKNDAGIYSLNSLSARPNQDGSFTIQFGGARETVPNYLPITPGWNYTVRLYKPRQEILDGSWSFPEAQPVT